VEAFIWIRPGGRGTIWDHIMSMQAERLWLFFPAVELFPI